MGGGTDITIRGSALSNPQPGSYQVLVGVNYVQIHLHQSGMFCILYKDVTFKNASGYSPYALVAINPGGGTSQTVDWTAGVTGLGAGVAPNEQFSTQTDLNGGHLIFFRNSSGGYNAMYTHTIPTDTTP